MVALAVVHMVEDMVGVVVDMVVEEVTAAGDNILSVLTPNLSRRAN